MAGQLDAAFALIDVHNLKASLPQFKLAVAAIVRSFGQASATLAATFYRDERRLAGILAPLTMKVADPPSIAEVSKNLDWATRTLWGPDAEIAFPDMQTMVTGAAEKMVLDTGRGTMFDTIASDRYAIGWARVPEPDACYFCALLATRNAVYKGESFNRSNSQIRANGRAFLDHAVTPSKFKVHDHCRCHLEAVFTAYEPTAKIREWTSLYNDLHHVNSSKGMQQAWRHAYEGRYGRQPSSPTPATPQGETP